MFAGCSRARRRRNRTFQAVGCTALLALKACMLVLSSCGAATKMSCAPFQMPQGATGAGSVALLLFAQSDSFAGMGLEPHGRWPWVAAGLVVPTWSLAAARRGELREDGLWVAGLAFPILVSHQSEEWVWPGGFLPFCNTRLLGSDRSEWPLTERDGFHVNVTAGWLSAVAGLALWRRTPVVAAGVLLMEASNVLMHASMAVRERLYNPGLVTATVLMVPHAAAGARWLARPGRVSRRGGLLASALGGAFCGPTAGDEDANAPRVAAVAGRLTAASLLSREAVAQIPLVFRH
jgi:hypothetical protein